MSQQTLDPILPSGSPTPEAPPVQEPPPDGRDTPVESPPEDDIDITPPTPERVAG